jgi:hypothetical protein
MIGDRERSKSWYVGDNRNLDCATFASWSHMRLIPGNLMSNIYRHIYFSLELVLSVLRLLGKVDSSWQQCMFHSRRHIRTMSSMTLHWSFFARNWNYGRITLWRLALPFKTFLLFEDYFISIFHTLMLWGKVILCHEKYFFCFI